MEESCSGKGIDLWGTSAGRSGAGGVPRQPAPDASSVETGTLGGSSGGGGTAAASWSGGDVVAAAGAAGSVGGVVGAGGAAGAGGRWKYVVPCPSGTKWAPAAMVGGGFGTCTGPLLGAPGAVCPGMRGKSACDPDAGQSGNSPMRRMRAAVGLGVAGHTIDGDAMPPSGLAPGACGEYMAGVGNGQPPRSPPGVR